MKTLAVIVTVIMTLLVGSFPAAAAHVMPTKMANVHGAMTSADAQSKQHACCDEAHDLGQQMNAKQHRCDNDQQQCLHCEQHCAAQLALPMPQMTVVKARSVIVITSNNLSLKNRIERLIRPPKPYFA